VTNLRDLTSSQLHRIIAIKVQIAALQSRLESIVGGNGEIPIPSAVEVPVPAKRKLSAAHRRKLVTALAEARKMRWAKMHGASATDSKPAKKKDRRSSPTGNSVRETEVRDTGRGLVQHLDEIGRQQGHAQLIQYLMNFRIHYADNGRGRSGGHGFRVKIREAFHPDTMPDWLKLAREQFPDLGEAIYRFADRHRDRLLRRHEREANITGLSNFIDVMVATSKVLFIYLRRGVLTQPQVTARLREYLNIFTGRIPQYRDQETTGYLARVYSNGNGNPGQLQRTFAEHNVSGNLHALLLVAQVVRGSTDGSDTSKAGSQLPMLVDQIKAFENTIGLGTATAVQIGRALEDYEMLTKQELALWTKDVKRGAKPEQEPPFTGSGDSSTTRMPIKQGQDVVGPTGEVGQDSSDQRNRFRAGGEGETQTVCRTAAQIDQGPGQGTENTLGQIESGNAGQINAGQEGSSQQSSNEGQT
jgi:hypothetical protein